MRRFSAFLLCLGALGTSQAATPGFDDLIALKGKALYKAADDIPYDRRKDFSAAELTTITERLAADKNQLTKEDDHRYAFGCFFTAACDCATGRELPRLITVYGGLEPASYEKRSLLGPLAGAWILHELEARTDWPVIELPRGASAPPAELAGAAPDLVAAWQLYKRSTETVEHAFEHGPEEKGISFQTNERAFDALVDKVLRKQGEHLAQELDRFLWSGWCGFGSDSLLQPQSLAFFMALLNENRIAEAVGAASHLQSDKPIVTRDGTVDARIAFLKKCGLDWEAILAGAQLESELSGRVFRDDSHCLEELATFGSERSATFLLEMARRSKPDMRSSYALALTAFVPGSTGNMDVGSSADLERQSAAPISDETKARVLALLEEFATPDAPSGVVEPALVAFARARSPETKPTLRALLQHPSARVAKSAAQILRSMGETVAPQKREPVRFQVLLNGAPVPKEGSLRWEITFGNSGSFSSNNEPDETGTIAIDREHFLDRERKATAVVFRNIGDSPQDPYFLVEIPVPPDLDQLTRVNVQLWPVEFQVASGAASALGREAKVQIKRHQETPDDTDKPSVYFDTLKREFTVPINVPIHLSVMSGSYDLTIWAPGAERLRTTFRVESQPATVSLRLQPGGDVHVELVRPDGEQPVAAVLLRNGHEIEERYFDYRTSTYRGLPTGNYILHIKSSAELAARDRREILAVQPWAGRDVPFTVVGNQAAPIELGEIRLDAASGN